MGRARTIITVSLAAAVLYGLVSAIPGNPVWRLFNRPVTVSATPGSDPGVPELKIVTLLPRDAIPAIFDPKFVTGDEAAKQMRPSDRIIGLSINGDHRAYSTAHLSSHEVVNDTVGGVPVAVTW